MVTDMWAEFGVNVEMKTLEGPAYSAEFWGGTFVVPMMSGPWSTTNPYDNIRWFLSDIGPNHWDNARFDELYLKAGTIRDTAEHDKAWKEVAIYWLEEAPNIPFPAAYLINAYWPWVKNYYGEVENSFYNYVVSQSTLWIDQDLKAELGY